ncbi:MAG TPA: hypothetical protein VF607_13420 [Verrucomicrobiae bacterium]
MINKKTGLIVLLASSAFGAVMAGNLNSYVSGGGDVLICFRKSAGDMVVDAGNISTFTGLTVNQRYPISSYTGTQLSQVGTNSLAWSAFTWKSDSTLYVTKPRPSAAVGVQTTPWSPQTAANQNQTIYRMAKVVAGAQDEASYTGFSTASAVITEDSSIGNPNFINGLSYRDAIFGSGSTANFFTTFQGVPENVTPSTFITSGKVQRSDFYQLTPATGSATWLGYFELSTNGSLSYVAYPLTTPVLQSIVRSGNQTTITYTAGVYGTYTLRSNASLNSGTAQTSWPAVGTLTSGDNTTHTITFTDNNPVSFYTITAQ